MRLKDIMNTSVETIRASETADLAWEKMRTLRIHHLVVMNGREIVGVVSQRDLGGKSGSGMRRNQLVSDFATGDVVCGSPGMTFQKAANLMRGNTIGCLPIVDQGRLEGIVTVSDLLELIGKGMEKPVVRSKRWTLKHRGRTGPAARPRTI